MMRHRDSTIQRMHRKWRKSSRRSVIFEQKFTFTTLLLHNHLIDTLRKRHIFKNPRTEDAATSTRNKRRRSQTSQSSAVMREQSKRSRAFDSREVDEQLLKTLNSKSGLEQLERIISSNHEKTLTTDNAIVNQNMKLISQAVPEMMRRRTRSLSRRSPAFASKVSRRKIE